MPSMPSVLFYFIIVHHQQALLKYYGVYRGHFFLVLQLCPLLNSFDFGLLQYTLGKFNFRFKNCSPAGRILLHVMYLQHRNGILHQYNTTKYSLKLPEIHI